MPLGLKRYQQEGDDHFITFSCHARRPYLDTPAPRDTFLRSLEQTRTRYDVGILGYVVMPEHVHLLVGEPYDRDVPLFKSLQSLKLSVSKRHAERPFWQTRYYDFNVLSHDKHIEKLHYMHRNPVTRGLVPEPEDWLWSSYRHLIFGHSGPVQLTPLWRPNAPSSA